MNKQTKEFEAFVAKMIYLQTVTVFVFRNRHTFDTGGLSFKLMSFAFVGAYVYPCLPGYTQAKVRTSVLGGVMLKFRLKNFSSETFEYIYTYIYETVVFMPEYCKHTLVAKGHAMSRDRQCT